MPVELCRVSEIPCSLIGFMTEQEGRIAPPPVLSQSRLSRSLAVLAQIIAQALGLLLAAGNDRHGVVAGDAAEHIGQLHRVDGRARRIGEPRQRLELRPPPSGSL